MTETKGAPQTKSTVSAKTSESGAQLVAAGILLSRLSGFVRQWVFARFFGNSDAGDAFYSALKIPNFLQNLFGEGVLSASFIPVYARFLSRDEHEEADRVARVIGSVLALAMAILTLGGILATPLLIELIAPGFEGEKRDLTIRLVQIFFPGTALLVLSAWCLGILNSHRKFFLSYAAPVVWNAAIVATLLFFGPRDGQSALAVHTAWGLVAGSALQFGVQLPSTLRFLKRRRFDFSTRIDSARTVFRNFVPVVAARGVVQISAYVDNVLASYLPSGAVSGLAYAQSLYMLPISLFGMAVSAAELPAMSSAKGTAEEVGAYLRARIEAGSRQVAFFIVPTILAFFALGDVIVSALFQSGAFTAKDSRAVWIILAGSTIGLLATTLGRLYSSAFYSLQDAKTPLRAATVRVTLTIALGYLCGLKVPGWLGVDAAYGTVGLTASAGFSGWVEFLILRRRLARRIGRAEISPAYLAKLWFAGALAVGVGYVAKLSVAGLHPPILRAVAVLPPTGLVYFAVTTAFGMDHALRFIPARFRRKK